MADGKKVERTLEQRRALLERARALSQQQESATAKPQVAAKKQQSAGLNFAQFQSDYAMAKGAAGDFYEFTAGQNKIRFVMNVSGDSFYAWCKQVYIPNVGEGRGKSFVSPKTLGADQYCPAAQLSNSIKSALKKFPARDQKAVEKLANGLWPSDIWYSNALVYESGEWRMRIVKIKRSVFRALFENMKNLLEDDEIINGVISEERNFASDKYGVIVVVNKEGTGLQTKYGVTITSKQRPVTADQLSQRVDLERYVEPADSQDIEDALCAAFGADSYADLIADPTQIAAPQDDEDAAPPVPRKQQRHARPLLGSKGAAKKQQPLPFDPDDEDDDTITDVDGDSDDSDDDAALDDTTEDVDDSSEQIPPCLANYGKPSAGFKCARCDFKAECEAISK